MLTVKTYEQFQFLPRLIQRNTRCIFVKNIHRKICTTYENAEKNHPVRKAAVYTQTHKYSQTIAFTILVWWNKSVFFSTCASLATCSPDCILRSKNTLYGVDCNYSLFVDSVYWHWHWNQMQIDMFPGIWRIRRAWYCNLFTICNTKTSHTIRVNSL